MDLSDDAQRRSELIQRGRRYTIDEIPFALNLCVQLGKGELSNHEGKRSLKRAANDSRWWIIGEWSEEVADKDVRVNAGSHSQVPLSN